jgi:hypothetical protein
MYTLEVTDANNCLIVDSIYLNQPTQIIGSITNNMVICPNEAIELSVTASGGTGNYQYLWTPNNQTNDTINEIPINSQIYSCEIMDNNECAILLSTSVIINVLDANDLNATIGSNDLCMLDSVSLTAHYSGSDTSVNLIWAHCPSCSTDNVIYETPSGNTEYIISGTNYCGQTIYDTVSVIVNPLPLISLAPTNYLLKQNYYMFIENLSSALIKNDVNKIQYFLSLEEKVLKDTFITIIIEE